VSTLVRYTPQNRVLDLAGLSPTDYNLITGLHGNIRHGDRVLLCLRPGSGDDEMYIRKRGVKHFAAHYPGGAHGPHPVALETDGHRRQKDYWARAAEDNGLHSCIEMPVRGGKMDVAITGGVIATDIEVQRTEIPVSLVKSRTTIYQKAGYLPIWFNDWGSRPRWLYDVPAMGCTSQPWETYMPQRRTVYATGLAVYKAVKCEVGAFDHCPNRPSGWCGRYHPQQGPWGKLTVDDVAGMIPASEIVPLRRRDGQVMLVSPASLNLYRELVGIGDWSHGSKPKTYRGRVLAGKQTTSWCQNPMHPAVTQDPVATEPAHAVPAPRTRLCNMCSSEPPGPGGILCATCKQSLEARLYLHST
jgi:hypothetical protein